VFGRTWTVISLATSDCHSAADSLTSSTAPVVIALQAVVIAAVTGWAARRTLFATLASID
ncbi:MAG: hypothetical protein E6848_21380, partial [Bradyrhizobium sp.]|nr:hypothetical protein [Bradyrhizobium sp.]